MIHFDDKSKFELPEGVIWNKFNNCFEFVDIVTGELWRYDLNNKTLKMFKRFDSNVGWLFPCTDKKNYIIGLKDTIVLWDSKADTIQNLANLKLDKNHRLNDAVICSGKLWFGVMNISKKNTYSSGYLCSFYNSDINIEDQGYVIPNGPIVGLNKTYLLHSDSYKGHIYHYLLDNNNIDLSSKRLVLDTSKLKASPDGMCIDRDGNIYVAMWGLGEIWKLDSSFNVQKKISAPGNFVTNLAFGGNDLNTLFVTYARDNEINKFGGFFILENYESFGIEQEYMRI